MYNSNDFKSGIYLGYKTHQVDVYIKRNQIIPGLRLKMKIDNRIDLVTEIDIKSSHEQQRIARAVAEQAITDTRIKLRD